MRLILASASPRRAELLAAAGFAFDVCVTDVDEQVRSGEPARAYVRRLASEKAARALELVGRSDAARSEALGAADAADREIAVVGADTAVVVDDEILGKPTDASDCERMLRRIAGRAHTVLTGVGVRSARRRLDEVVETVVHVDELTDEEISWYVASGEGLDKAGGYGIQGLASRFIPRVEGSYTNVVGLPVGTVYRLLARLRG